MTDSAKRSSRAGLQTVKSPMKTAGGLGGESPEEPSSEESKLTPDEQAEPRGLVKKPENRPVASTLIVALRVALILIGIAVALNPLRDDKACALLDGAAGLSIAVLGILFRVER